MAELVELLPKAMLYLASGFAFINGYYFLLEKRFNFFSEISVWIILIWGFWWTNLIKAVPNIFHITDETVKNVIVVVVSLCIGVVIAGLRNFLERKGSKWLVSIGRKRTFTKDFWYSLIDEPDKPITVRLKSYERKYIMEGVLCGLSEDDENPYLLLGYCMKYDLEGKILDKSYAENKYAQMIVKPDGFDEVMLIYAEGSSKVPDITLEV